MPESRTEKFSLSLISVSTKPFQHNVFLINLFLSFSTPTTLGPAQKKKDQFIFWASIRRGPSVHPGFLLHFCSTVFIAYDTEISYWFEPNRCEFTLVALGPVADRDCLNLMWTLLPVHVNT